MMLPVTRYSPETLCCIGVTGTNGKTSCAWWIAQLLQQFGRKTALVGTLGAAVLERGRTATLKDTGYTTPDARLLEGLLADFVRQGATHVVMEVSSHGLEQDRTRAVTFSSALFTNLSRDHLDYHGTMERYGAAKEKLFIQDGLRHAVINVDDAFGAGLAQRLKARDGALRVLTYSLEQVSADLHVQDLRETADGFAGVICTPWGRCEFRAPVTGRFNLANLLGVCGVLCAEGLDLESVIRSWPQLSTPPGRLEPVTVAGSDVRVFVDYAHSPDALEKVLTTLRPQTAGQLWCVFGCGGDRDKGKRPLMGVVASRLADRCVVTSDNPRSEDPHAIIREIVATMETDKVIVQPDRHRAIAEALQRAQRGDVVLVAGKGHEKYQEYAGIKQPFDDVVEAREALQQRLVGGAAA